MVSAVLRRFIFHLIVRNYPCVLRDSINRCMWKKEKSASVIEDYGLIVLISAFLGIAGNLVNATDPPSHSGNRKSDDISSSVGVYGPVFLKLFFYHGVRT